MEKSVRRIIPLLCLPVLLLGLSSAPGGAAEQNSCLTSNCHQALMNKSHVHPGADPCETCHQQAGSPHPVKKQKTFALTDKVPNLCYQCHAQFGAKKTVHPPVKGGACTTCHNPHASFEAKLLAKPVKKLCLSCHADKGKFKNTHAPVESGDCTSCHNPHETDTPHLLVQDVPGLCFTCHYDKQDEIKKKVVHPALDAGCTACHNPHGSDFKKFLSAGVPDLCFQCHSSVDDKLKSATDVHPPVKSDRSCLSCHVPHASDNAKLLQKTGRELCLGCHKDIIKKNQTELHGPIKKGACTPCHDPHGNTNYKLLVKPYSPDFYVSPYTDEEFPLCFSCHNRDLLKFPTTSYATNFRDGDKNLHYIHVNKKSRGKRCRVCHMVHASENPKLITDKVMFGNWNLPIRFVKTETGGGCSPGCHEPYGYDRKSPVKGGKPPKATAKEKPKK